MGLNNTPASERVHIAFFGCTNAGKSSVINAVTSQKLSIVSPVRGTTTDPVSKTMELLPLGPVVIIDTPGLNDSSVLGEMRIERTLAVLDKTDIAVLVVDSETGFTEEDGKILEAIENKKIPFVVCYNKSDIKKIQPTKQYEISVSAVSGEGIEELKELIASRIKKEEPKKIAADLIESGSIAVLVIPIDSSAPKGRLILPQQQTIRDLLESGNVCVTVRDTELKNVIDLLGDKIGIVITDSQRFGAVSKIVPDNIPLTSFSILFLRYKGELDAAVEGVKALDKLQDGDTVLIAEGCTHHRQCEDIGTVKMPKWIENYTSKKLNFEFVSGAEFPRELDKYSLIVHCGGCMLNAKEMHSRIEYAGKAGVAITNYGIAIAYMNGILGRSVKPLGIEL